MYSVGLFMQMPGDDKGIATIIARAGEDQDRPGFVGLQSHRQVGRRLAGLFHQGLMGVGGFDMA